MNPHFPRQRYWFATCNCVGWICKWNMIIFVQWICVWCGIWRTHIWDTEVAPRLVFGSCNCRYIMWLSSLPHWPKLSLPKLSVVSFLFIVGWMIELKCLGHESGWRSVRIHMMYVSPTCIKRSRTHLSPAIQLSPTIVNFAKSLQMCQKVGAIINESRDTKFHT